MVLGYISPVLTMLSGLSRLDDASYRRLARRDSTVSVPEDFSLIGNPGPALALAQKLATDARQKRLRMIHFDHSKVKHIDLGAESLLALTASELSKEFKSRRLRPPGTYGLYPQDRFIRRLMRAVGVIRGLGISHEYLPVSEAKPLRVFEVTSWFNDSPSAVQLSQKKSLVAASFVLYVDRCLKERGAQLTWQGKEKLCEYMGEILGNAEDHAGTGHWTVLGYLDHEGSGAHCEIVIYNFGRSFAQTFQALPRDGFAFTQVAPYLEAHSKRFLFDSGWNEADLLTLAALQGHISSRNQGPQDNYGQGTVDLIGFFQRVHQELKTSTTPARMALISGNTYILFDGTYQMAPGADGRKTIAFNAANDLSERPDARYVRNLGNFSFPGTIITIKFPLSREGSSWMLQQ